MTEFRAIPDSVYKEAGDVVMHAHRGGTPPEVEVMPGFGAMVSASALALEKGAPHTVFDTQETSAERYLDQGTNEWRMFHRSVARVIDLHRTGEQQFDEPNDVMNHIVGDVANQGRMRRVEMALTNSHPAFLEGVSERDRDLVQYARDDDMLAAEIKSEAMGAYEKLPRFSQDEIGSQLITGSKLSPEVKEQISASYTAVTEASNNLGHHNRYVNERLANFADFDSPLFKEIDPAAVARVDHLSHGATRLPSNVEMGVIAHERIFPTKGDGMADYDVRVARARALGDMQSDGRIVSMHYDPAQVAIAIEADRIAIAQAQRSHMLDPADVTLRDELVRNATDHHLLRGEDQVALFQDIRQAEAVPGIVAMRLSRAALEIQAESNTMEPVMARPDRGVDRSIVYEGVDLSDKADLYPTDRLKLPGDDVRIDHSRHYYRDAERVDTREVEALLGADPLTVSKTIVQGIERDDGMGGSNLVMRTEHEFVGKEGRYPTDMFMDHRGEEHAYGMLAVHNEKLWLVPMEDNGNPQHNAEVVGAPREVTSFAQGATDREREDNFIILKHEVEQKAMSGEFYFRPEMFGDKSGRVDIIASPFMAEAWSREEEIGMAALRNRTGSEWGESLEQASAEFRERNGRPSLFQRDIEADDGVRRTEYDQKGVDIQRGGFREEMKVMLEDIERSPAVISTASEIAARGRPLDPKVEAQTMINEMRRGGQPGLDAGMRMSR